MSDYIDEAISERLRRENEAAKNNMERAIAILTPLFIEAQEAGYPDEEALGGALDVLTGWFGQNGKPLRRLDELEAALKDLRENRDEVHQWNKGQALTIRRLDEEIAQVREQVEAERWAKQTLATGFEEQAQRIRKQDAEIEQLRKAEGAFLAEVARLRTELMYADADVKLLEAEVKQLGEAFGEIVAADDE